MFTYLGTTLTTLFAERSDLRGAAGAGPDYMEGGGKGGVQGARQGDTELPWTVRRHGGRGSPLIIHVWDGVVM